MSNSEVLLSDEFRDFLIDAKQNGYGSDGVKKYSTPSGGHEILYQNGDWLYTDVFVGGDPFSGFEHVSYKRENGKEYWLPVWGMSYRGRVLDPEFSSRITPYLGKVLAEPEYEMPLRGPFSTKLGDNEYEFEYDGTLEEFTASERFFLGDNNLYIAQFAGGLANMQAWDEKPHHVRPKPWIK